VIDVDDRLRRHIERSATDPVVWGESDCTAWAARWVGDFHDRSLALPRWRSREEAYALIASAGSLAALWSDALARFGLPERFDAPQAGDVGIIETRVAGQVGVIFIHDALVAWRGAPTGARFLRPHPQAIVKVWALT
jgi:hypothetical protein